MHQHLSDLYSIWEKLWHLIIDEHSSMNVASHVMVDRLKIPTKKASLPLQDFLGERYFHLSDRVCWLKSKLVQMQLSVVRCHPNEGRPYFDVMVMAI